MFSMFIGLCLWGLKLEARIDSAIQQDITYARQLAAIEVAIRPGILKLAEERIQELRRDFEEFKQIHERNYTPARELIGPLEKDIERLEAIIKRLESR